jgi:CRISPR-associated endonuclease Cas2
LYKLIFYDIENDKTRTSLAKKLEEMGLERLQYSVFIGNGNHVYWSKVFEKIKVTCQKFNMGADSCCFLTVDEKQLKAMAILGKKAIANNFVMEAPEYIIL